MNARNLLRLPSPRHALILASTLLLALGTIPAKAAIGDPDDALTYFGARPIFTNGTKPAVIVDDFGWIDYTWTEQKRTQVAATIAEWNAQGIQYAAYFALGGVETDAANYLGNSAKAEDLDGSVSNSFVFTRSAFRDYLIASGKLAVDLGATYFLLDNGSPNLEALSFDDEVIAGFRTYLNTNYTSGELTAMGVTDVNTFDYRDYLKSPAGGSYTTSDSFASSPPSNALFDAWMGHLREVERGFFVEWTGEIQLYASTTYGKTVHFGANRYTTSRQWDNIDLFDFGMAETFLDSLGYPYRNLEAIYKLAPNFGKRFWSWNFPSNTGTMNGTNDPFGHLHITELSKVFAAETFANGGLEQLPIDWLSYTYEDARLGDFATYLRFPYKHPELFNLDQAGEVAVVYNEAFEAADTGSFTPSFQGTVLMLGDLHRPSDVLFAADPDKRSGVDPFASVDLGAYKAVVLPNARMLTDAQVSKLESYLSGGGVVIGLGQIADLDEDGNDVSGSRTFDDYFASDGSTSVGSGTAICFTTDLGSAYYAAAATNVSEGVWEFTTDNGNDLASYRSTWSAAVDPEVSTDFDTTLSRLVHVNRFVDSDGSHVYQIVNRDITIPSDVDSETINATSAATCSVAIPDGFTSGTTTLSWMTVDSPQPTTLSFTVNGSKLDFTLPSFAVWGVLKVGSAASAAQALDDKPEANFNLQADTGGHRPDELDANDGVVYNYWYWKGGNHGAIPWNIPFLATDDNEVDAVKLFYRFSTDKNTWSDWTLHSTKDATGTNVSDSFSFDAPDGEGYYQFRLQAVDGAGQEEVVTDRDETAYGVDETPPSPPETVSVTGGYASGSWIPDVSSLTFTWSFPSDNLSGYLNANVTIATDSADITGASLSNSVTSWSPTLSGLEAGVRHYLRIQHEDAAGNWASSTNIFSFYSGTAPVGDLTDPVVTEGDGALTVAWTIPADAAYDHTEVSYRPAGDAYGSWIGAGQTPDASTAQLEITGLQNDTAYQVRLVAISTAGQPGNDIVVGGSYTPQGGSGGGGGGSTLPAAPTDLVAQDNTANVHLTWIDHASDETGYVLECRLDGTATWTEVATLGENAQAFTDNIDIGVDTYFYRVKATNGAGSSDYSNTASIARSSGGGSGGGGGGDGSPVPTPSAPQIVSANANSITFSWTVGAGSIDSFRVERQTPAGAFTTIGETPANVLQFTDTPLDSGADFEYRVVAVGTSSESDPSPVSAFSTKSLEGYFIGTLEAGAGTFGLIVDAHGKAMCIIDLEGAAALLEGHDIVVDANGNFTFTSGDATIYGSVSFAGSAGPASTVQSLGDTYITVAVGDAQIGGSAARETSDGAHDSASGYYQGVAGGGLSMGIIHNLVAPSGKVLVIVEASDGTIDSGVGTADANNSFSVVLDSQETVSGSFLTESKTFSGSISSAEGEPTSFASVTEGSVVETDRLVNISTRGPTTGGTGNMIGGFVIQGSGPKQVLVTAKGPSLIPYGITNALPDPKLTLYRLNGGANEVVHIVSSWKDEPNADAIAASGFGPTNDAEAAMLLVLDPGIYTAVISSDQAGSADGVSIVEVYENDQSGVTSTSRLVNISTRGLVGSGENVMIAGLVVSGTLPKTLLIDAKGPSLAPYGISNYLPNPKIQLVKIGNPNEDIGTNLDWGNEANAADITATGYAPTDPAESAMLVTLEPGIYTAIVSSETPLDAGDMRVVLVEAYEIAP